METPITHLHTKPVDLDAAQHPRIRAHAHAVPMWILLTTFAALMVLTVLTVGVYEVEKRGIINLGPFSIWAALAIALIKAAIVALYFMHLRWDSPFNALVLISSLLFVSLFLGAAIMDSREYQKNYTPPPVGTPE